MQKSRIDSALDELLKATPPVICVESVPRPKGSPGTATKIYRLTGANCANSANSEQRLGFEPASGDREVCDASEVSKANDSTVRIDRTVRKHENPTETRIGIDDSHNSRSSQSDSIEPSETNDSEVF